MADQYVTMVSYDLGPRVEPSVANFVVEKGADPRVAASQCAAFAMAYPSALKLRIMCHGGGIYLENPIKVAGVRVPYTGKVAWGKGIMFGDADDDDIYYSNMMPRLFSFIHNCFDAVSLVACGAAGEHPKATPWGQYDGKGLCRALAHSANAPVWAADREQTSNNPIFGGGRTLNAWTGNVYVFPPDGSPGKLVIKG